MVSFGQKKNETYRKKMIGLFDADVSEFGVLPFNLELMKLASYYKSQKRETHLLEEFTPQKYDLIYLRRDFLDEVDLSNFLAEKKVIAGGYYFTRGMYVPFSEEIEDSYPDKSIYMRYANETNNWRQNLFKASMESEHLRLSLDNHTIDPNYKKFLNYGERTKRVLLHDYNLSLISGSFEEINRLSRNYGDKRKQTISIDFKYPIQVDTVEDLMKWTSPHFVTNLYSIQVNGIMSNELVQQIIEQKRKKGVISVLLYMITDPEMEEEIFIKEIAPLVFWQVGVFAHAGIGVRLSFVQNYFSDERYTRLLDLFNYYGKSILTTYALRTGTEARLDSLANFCRKLDEEPNPMFPAGLTKVEARELFKFVYDKNKELFKLFYKPMEFVKDPINLSSSKIYHLQKTYKKRELIRKEFRRRRKNEEGTNKSSY